MLLLSRRLVLAASLWAILPLLLVFTSGVAAWLAELQFLARLG